MGCAQKPTPTWPGNIFFLVHGYDACLYITNYSQLQITPTDKLLKNDKLNQLLTQNDKKIPKFKRTQKDKQTP